MENVALVVGARGVIGTNLVEHLAGLPDWRVIGLSRRGGTDIPGRLRHVAVDLLDPDDTRKQLSGLSEVTHVFYVAYQDRPTWAELVAPNLAMLVNVVEAIEPIARGLRHVSLMQGYKVYGAHLGPFKTPAREDDPPCVPAYFYEAQHDHVLKLQQGKSWTWSTTRPGAVCGYGNGARINLMTVLAVYGTIMKALKQPFYFPGDEDTYNAITFASDVRILNRAMLWASTDSRAANQAFNIGNGDSFRWKYMWPRLAAMFDLEPGPVKTMRLTEFMADKKELWNEIVAGNGLRQTDLFRLVPWAYADTVFRRKWDNMISMVKAYQYGFTEMIDSEQMMKDIIGDFRAQKIIP